MKQVLFRTITIEETNFEHCDDRAIVIFHEFRFYDLNDYERTRKGKGQQTKTEKFEHCDDNMFLVSKNITSSLLFLSLLPSSLLFLV